MSYATVKDNDYWESWFVTYDKFLKRLKSKKQSEYWDRWFEVYSAKMSLLGANSVPQQ